MTSQISVAKPRQRGEGCNSSFFFCGTNLIQPTTGSWCERSDSWSYPWGFFSQHILANKISIWITICSNFLASLVLHVSTWPGISKVCRGSSCTGAIYCLFYFKSEVIPRQFSSSSSLTILTSDIYRVGVSSGDHQEAGVTDKLSGSLRCRARKKLMQNIQTLVISDLSPLKTIVNDTRKSISTPQLFRGNSCWPILSSLINLSGSLCGVTFRSFSSWPDLTYLCTSGWNTEVPLKHGSGPWFLMIVELGDFRGWPWISKPKTWMWPSSSGHEIRELLLEKDMNETYAKLQDYKNTEQTLPLHVLEKYKFTVWNGSFKSWKSTLHDTRRPSSHWLGWGTESLCCGEPLMQIILRMETLEMRKVLNMYVVDILWKYFFGKHNKCKQKNANMTLIVLLSPMANIAFFRMSNIFFRPGNLSWWKISWSLALQLGPWSWGRIAKNRLVCRCDENTVFGNTRKRFSSFSPKNFKKLIYHLFLLKVRSSFIGIIFDTCPSKKKNRQPGTSWSPRSGLWGSWRSAGFPAATWLVATWNATLMFFVCLFFFFGRREV